MSLLQKYSKFRTTFYLKTIKASFFSEWKGDIHHLSSLPDGGLQHSSPLPFHLRAAYYAYDFFFKIQRLCCNCLLDKQMLGLLKIAIMTLMKK